MSNIKKNLGHVTAYAYYKAGGGTMTEEEFTEYMADFGDAAERAVDAASEAAQSKADAQTAAATATDKADEAAASASSASGSAASAAEDASTASTAANTATGAATTATSAKNDAVSAKNAAQSAKTSAETAASTATTKASEAATSATNAAASAQSVASSAAQITQNAEDIDALKEDKSDKAGYRQINELNTTFFTIGDNRYNVKDVEDGVMLNQATEGVHAESSLSTSGFVYVGNLSSVKFWRRAQNGTQYNETAYYVLYDNNRQRLGSRQVSTSADVSNATWIRVSSTTQYTSSFMILDSSITPVTYIPFKYDFAYGTRYYNSVNEMTSDNDLIIGDIVCTLGYYTENDGGGSRYVVSASAQYPVLANTPWCISLNNGLYANLINHGNVYDARQLGVKIYKNIDDPAQAEDSTAQLNVALMATIPFSDLPFRYTLYIPNGYCNVSGTLYLRNGNVIKGSGYSTSRINQYPTQSGVPLLKVGIGLINGEEVADYGPVTNNGYSKFVDGLWFATDNVGIESMGDGWIISNCWFNGGGTGIRCRGADGAINNCIFEITSENGIVVGNDNENGSDNNIVISNCIFRSSTYGIVIKTITDLAITGCVFGSIAKNCIKHTDGRARDISISGCIFLSSTENLVSGYSQVYIANDQIYAKWNIVGCTFRSSEAEGCAGLKIDGARFVNITGCSFVKNHYGIHANNACINITGCKFRQSINYDICIDGNIGTVVPACYMVSSCLFDSSHLRISSETNEYLNSCIIDNGNAEVHVSDCYSSDARAIFSTANANAIINNCSSEGSHAAIILIGTKCKCFNSLFAMWSSTGDTGTEVQHDGSVITAIMGKKLICTSYDVPAYTDRDICLSTQQSVLGWMYNGSSWEEI